MSKTTGAKQEVPGLRPTARDLRAVVRDPLQGDQPLGAEHPQQLNEQILHIPPPCPEVRQGVVVDCLQAGKPLDGGIELHLPRDRTRRADAPGIGIDPDAGQQPRIPRRASRAALHRLHALAGFRLKAVLRHGCHAATRWRR